jgi:subtilisin family serine protease
MTKKLLFPVFFLFSLSLFAQSKISLSLLNRLENSSRAADSKISVLVKGNIDEIKAKTEQIGGIFKYSADSIANIQIPLDKVGAIADLASVSRIEDNNFRWQPLNDVALIHNHADLVHQGFGLPQGYDGQGVVLAIIDAGLEVTHPDFKNTDGTTRIKYFWDQTDYTTDSNSRPQPFDYGVEYVGSQIDTVSHSLDDAYSHGTHVTGSACGNGLALNNYRGMAPKADIVFIKLVGLDENSANSSLVDAVLYAFACGDSLNKPVVINLSVGDYFGSHDGRDLQAQTIDALLDITDIEGNGRVVVAAAGNEGGAPIHLGYTIEQDTLFTWMQYQNHPISLEVWSDTANFRNAEFGIAIDRVSPNYQWLGGNGFNNVNSYLNIVKRDTIYAGTNRLGIVYTASEILNGSYHISITIKPDSTYAPNINYYWRFMTKGSGKFDAWGFDLVRDGLPTSTQFPLITRYKKPDTDQTIVSSFQCSDKVITVGSYDNRQSFTNALFQQSSDTAMHPGQLSFFSSHGPTRDGRNKPDITAPGAWVLSCGGQSNLDWLYANDPAREAAGRKHFRSSGTSFSSPMVAGICALYLQRYPNANWQEVKTKLLSCSTKDSFTGNALPNNLWGHGKANAYSMVQGCLIGMEEANAFSANISIYPNPFTEYTTVEYDLTSAKYNTAELKIYDMLGNEIKSIPLSAKRNSMFVSRSDLRSGVYFYSLMIDGKAAKTNKLVIL